MNEVEKWRKEREEEILNARKCPICKKLILRGSVLLSKGLSYHLDCFGSKIKSG